MRAVACALLAMMIAGCQTISTGMRADPITQTRVDAAMGWIAGHSDLPLPDRRPVVAWVPLSDIQSAGAAVRVMLPGSLRRGARTGALYDGMAIYVPEETRPFSIWGQALLLHETVHYMQHRSGRRYACTAAMEQEAYRLMFAYMREHGHAFEQSLQSDPEQFLASLACPADGPTDLPAWAMANRH
ncbi:MAG: hypothetical protein AB7G39_00715 [Alphaproteobacteria bacterium]